MPKQQVWYDVLHQLLLKITAQENKVIYFIDDCIVQGYMTFVL